MSRKPKKPEPKPEFNDDEAILSGRNIPPEKANRAQLVAQQNYDWDISSDFYSDEILPKMEELASKGFNNKQIAEGLGVKVRAFEEWCRKYPQFAFALSKYRGVADIFVENALYKAAVGFNYIEQQVSPLGGVVEVTKYMPGNVAAQKFYLVNRMQERYKNKIEQTLKVGENVSGMSIVIRRREE